MTGEKLKERREALGYSQEKLAKVLGIHAMTLSRWERGILEVPLYMGFALRTIEREKPRKAKKAT